VNISAPPCVDHTVYLGKDDMKVYLLNYQNFFPPIPISDVSVSIKLDGRKVRSVTDIANGKTEWKLTDGKIEIHTDLDNFKMIHIELE